MYIKSKLIHTFLHLETQTKNYVNIQLCPSYRYQTNQKIDLLIVGMVT